MILQVRSQLKILVDTTFLFFLCFLSSDGRDITALETSSRPFVNVFPMALVVTSSWCASLNTFCLRFGSIFPAASISSSILTDRGLSGLVLGKAADLTTESFGHVDGAPRWISMSRVHVGLFVDFHHITLVWLLCRLVSSYPQLVRLTFRLFAGCAGCASLWSEQGLPCRTTACCGQGHFWTSYN